MSGSRPQLSVHDRSLPSVGRAAQFGIGVLLALACGAPPPPPAHVHLEGNVVAKVGGVAITTDLVAEVASRQRSTPREALDRLIDDALASEAAHAKSLDAQTEVAWSLNSTRARLTTARIAAEARAKGPPTDQEVAKATERHWRDFDLPEHVRVIHAIVLRKDGINPIAAASIAGTLRAAVLGVRDDADFERVAMAVPAAGYELKVERLPSFTADGRIVETEGGMDLTFASAAFALAPGDTSPVVETKFGWHVIRLLERLPARRVPLAERRVALADGIYSLRAREAYLATLLRVGGGAVTIDPAAEELMGLVTVDR